MHIPKRYGQSKIDRCPFCGKQATLQNSQGIPVCTQHNASTLKDMKCLCGEWLDIRQGKFGPYFNCPRCGNVNFRKAMEMNPLAKSLPQQERGHDSPPAAKKPSPREITVRSDELDLLY